MLMPVGTVRQILLLVLLVLSPLVQAQRQAAEPELKAAILVNMLLFVDWPSNAKQANDRLTLCYLEASPITTALDSLSGKLLKGKPLQVQTVTSSTTSSCHALYLSPWDSNRLAEVVANSRANAVLLIGDSPEFFQHGVMLNLAVDDGRVVFDIDLRSARQAGFTLSSKVMRLARKVVE
jgi:hypothetical protein